MKVMLIKDGRAQVVELDRKHDYRDIKRLLEIDSPIDCQVRKIAGRNFDIWLDDEGLLKGKRHELTAAVFHGEDVVELFVGNLLIAHHDNEGNMRGLTEQEIEMVRNEIKKPANERYKDAEIYYACDTILKFREDGHFLRLTI